MESRPSKTSAVYGEDVTLTDLIKELAKKNINTDGAKFMVAKIEGVAANFDEDAPMRNLVWLKMEIFCL